MRIKGIAKLAPGVAKKLGVRTKRAEEDDLNGSSLPKPSLKVIYSVVTNVRDNKPRKINTTLRKLQKRLVKPTPRGEMSLSEYLACKDDPERKHLADAQKDGKGFIPGVFSTDGTRTKDDLVSRTFLVLDLDDGFYSIKQLKNVLQGLECFIHTSYSHSMECGKYRVIIPFDKPVTGDIEGTCSRMLDYFQSILGDHIDTKCWTVSQLYFFPSCPPDAVDLYRCVHVKGKLLQTSDFLMPEIDEDVFAEARKPSGHRPGDDYNLHATWKDLLTPLGWKKLYKKQSHEYWTRPGKRMGISAVVFLETNVLYIHSSAPQIAPFEANKAYTPFTAYSIIKHEGDFSAAAKQLKLEGYGKIDVCREQGQDESESQERGSSTFPVVPFPFDVLPEYFQQLSDKYSRALQCSQAVMVMNMVVVASGAAGNSVALAIKRTWLVSSHIWLGIIDETGSGKTHPIENSMKPVIYRQSKNDVSYENKCKEYKAKKAAYEKDKKGGNPPKEPKPKRHYYSNNFTIEALIPMFQVSSRGIILYVDELAGLLKSFNQYRGGKGSDAEQFLSLFNCGPLKSDRKNGGGFCRESGAAVIGGIQPKVFSEVFSDKEHSNGMVYRFLPMLVNSSPPMFSYDELSEENEDIWNNLVDWLYKINAPIDPQTGCIIKNCLIVEDSGRKAWEIFHNKLSRLQPFMPDQFKGYMSKLKIYCLKFMVVLHLLKCYPKNKLSQTVRRSTVKGAIKLTEYFAGQAMQLVLKTSKERNPYEPVIREALLSLEDEVKRGKLQLSRVRTKVNELLPSKLAIDSDRSKELAGYLRDMGLEVKPGAGNKSIVFWSSEIISS